MNVEIGKLLIPHLSPGNQIWDAVFRELGLIQEFVLELKDWFIDFGRVLSGALIVIGVVLWASDVFSYKGRKLITAGVILFFVLEAIASI